MLQEIKAGDVFVCTGDGELFFVDRVYQRSYENRMIDWVDYHWEYSHFADGDCDLESVRTDPELILARDEKHLLELRLKYPRNMDYYDTH